MPLNLTIQLLKKEASAFAREESTHDEPSLFGVTDGKVVGTYLEHKFQQYLIQKYTYVFGSSANRPPEIGYLTISNALQWRLQYSRVIQQAGTTSGIEKL